jgi:FtsP/CotA-like multicopper oxidase with cupredoxin domain
MARFLVPSSAAAILALLPLHASMTDGGASADPPCPPPIAAESSADRLQLFASLDRLLDATATPAQTCPRPAAGSIVEQPRDLWSENGVLAVEFEYYTTTDSDNRTLYCFQTPDGVQSPTLHIKPGDRLDLTLHNQLPPPSGASNWPTIASIETICGAARQNASSVNLHFHGTNTSPACHADNVIHTIVNAGRTFRYSVKIPKDEPPGLYGYHPHIYGLADAAVQGGATGAIVVDGIENLQPAVSGLPERILMVRDQSVAGSFTRAHDVPSLDITLNYVPIPYPAYTPAVIQMQPGEKEFWRLANASANTTLDVVLEYDETPQPLEIVAFDGVPVGSQDGRRQGRTITRNHILVPPAGRVEFIMTAPSASVQNAALVTRRVHTGPKGFIDPTRTLATISPTRSAEKLPVIPLPSAAPNPQRFEGLDSAPVTAHRKLYFSEQISANPTFYITVDGAQPTVFAANNPPSIVTTQGAVEEWTIENRAYEVHAFHIHQIHFKLVAENGAPVPPRDQQFYDTINIPYWSGTGPYPSVTLRMDFRGLDVGDFVYHCHILTHEDRGMMAIIRVLPRS